MLRPGPSCIWPHTCVAPPQGSGPLPGACSTHRPASSALGSSSGPQPRARPRHCRRASGPPATGSRAAAGRTGALGDSAPAVDTRGTVYACRAPTTATLQAVTDSGHDAHWMAREQWQPHRKSSNVRMTCSALNTHAKTRGAESHGHPGGQPRATDAAGLSHSEGVGERRQGARPHSQKPPARHNEKQVKW